jgi:DNA replication protein DnaC
MRRRDQFYRAVHASRSVHFQNVPNLFCRSPATQFQALALGRGYGRHGLFKTLSRVDLLIPDEWSLPQLTGEQRRDLLEVVDDRHQRGSTIITSQVPIGNWQEVIADPTIADYQLADTR